MMMIALLAIPFAMQAQTKFHDVEANDAKGNVKSISMNMMGNDVKMTNIYDDKGVLTSQKMGDNMEIVYTDYKFDDKGNWISRKTQVMGQEMTTSRTIVYY